MTTWADLREDARSVIQDDQAPYFVSDRLLLRYANYGLGWIATRHAQTVTTTVAVEDGLLTLPPTWLVIETVYADEQPQRIDQLAVDGPYPVPGHVVFLDRTTMRLGDKGVTEAEVCYRSSYPPLADADEIPLDAHLEEALLYYVIARGFSQRAGASANLDQFDRRSDSGKPTDNPLLQMADHYLKQARQLLDTYPQRPV